MKAYDHPSWMKHYATPMWPPLLAQAGNGRISTEDMLVKLATYYQNETLKEAATLFVRSN